MQQRGLMFATVILPLILHNGLIIGEQLVSYLIAKSSINQLLTKNQQILKSSALKFLLTRSSLSSALNTPAFLSVMRPQQL